MTIYWLHSLVIIIFLSCLVLVRKLCLDRVIVVFLFILDGRPILASD